MVQNNIIRFENLWYLIATAMGTKAGSFFLQIAGEGI